MRNVTADEGDAIAGVKTGYSGVFFEQGGWVNPPQLVCAMLDAAQQLNSFKSLFNCHIEQLNKQPDGWCLGLIYKEILPVQGTVQFNLDKMQNLNKIRQTAVITMCCFETI